MERNGERRIKNKTLKTGEKSVKDRRNENKSQNNLF